MNQPYEQEGLSHTIICHSQILDNNSRPLLVHQTWLRVWNVCYEAEIWGHKNIFYQLDRIGFRKENFSFLNAVYHNMLIRMKWFFRKEKENFSFLNAAYHNMLIRMDSFNVGITTCLKNSAYSFQYGCWNSLSFLLKPQMRTHCLLRS